MRRAVIAATLSGTLLAGTVIGATLFGPDLVGAQGDPTTTTTAPAAPKKSADWLGSALQPLVDNNTITAAQRDAVIAALDAARPPGGPGRDHHGPGMGRKGGPFASEAVTSLLGVDAATLRTELEAGKTLAAIAAEKGIAVQKLVDAIVAEKTAEIDAAVAAGKVTQERATAAKAEITQRVTDMVNGVRPTSPEGGPGMGRPPFGGGMPGGGMPGGGPRNSTTAA